jgi:hypothetical protein
MAAARSAVALPIGRFGASRGGFTGLRILKTRSPACSSVATSQRGLMAERGKIDRRDRTAPLRQPARRAF